MEQKEIEIKAKEVAIMFSGLKTYDAEAIIRRVTDIIRQQSKVDTTDYILPGFAR